MARLPRLTVPGYPHHVIQRGNNRQMIFRDAADHEFMLGLLTEQAKKLQVEIHAYCSWATISTCWPRRRRRMACR